MGNFPVFLNVYRYILYGLGVLVIAQGLYAVSEWVSLFPEQKEDYLNLFIFIALPRLIIFFLLVILAEVINLFLNMEEQIFEIRAGNDDSQEILRSIDGHLAQMNSLLAGGASLPTVARVEDETDDDETSADEA